MASTKRFRLSVLLFLQYFIWGSWYVTMGTYMLQTLHFSGIEVGMAYGATAIAAMVTPFFSGVIADKFFSTEKLLGCLHLLGAVFMYYMTTVQSFVPFYLAVMLYTLMYTPTLSLSNSLIFHHISMPEQNFPKIRAIGTLGWISTGLLIGFLAIEKTFIPLRMAAIASFILGIYSFSLPNTPPLKKNTKISVKEILGFDALRLLKDRSFAILIIAFIMIRLPSAFYSTFGNLFFNEIGVVNAAGKMTIGQIAEVCIMIALPFFFARLGMKKMIMIGMGAWVIRYILFSLGDSGTLEWLLYLGMLLHGVCFSFLFIVGQIYVDKVVPIQIRGAAQGLISFSVLGIGSFLGMSIAGLVVEYYAIENNQHNWETIWLIPAVGAFIVLVLFGFLFKQKKEGKIKV